MQFISNSHDILFLTIAFCILLVTIFFAYFLYIAVMSVRQVYELIRQIKSKVEALDGIISLVKDKILGAGSYLTLIVGGVRKIVDILGSKDEEKKKRSKR